MNLARGASVKQLKAVRSSAAEGIGVLPWSPLARGRLTRDWDESSGRTQTDEFGKKLYAAMPDADRRIVEQVAEIAQKRGVPRAQIALFPVLMLTIGVAWLLMAAVYLRACRAAVTHAGRMKVYYGMAAVAIVSATGQVAAMIVGLARPDVGAAFLIISL